MGHRGGEKSVIATKKGSSTGTSFSRGEKVEVMSKQYGYVGSYYSAKIVSELDDGSYVVKYSTLLNEDDQSRLLVETVEADEIRPVPIKVDAKVGFRLNDYVDAYDRDGWWVGRVVGKVGFGCCTVYFDTTGDKIGYPLEKLRTHLVWAQSRIDGRWNWWHVHQYQPLVRLPQTRRGGVEVPD